MLYQNVKQLQKFINYLINKLTKVIGKYIQTFS